MPGFVAGTVREPVADVVRALVVAGFTPVLHPAVRLLGLLAEPSRPTAGRPARLAFLLSPGLVSTAGELVLLGAAVSLVAPLATASPALLLADHLAPVALVGTVASLLSPLVAAVPVPGLLGLLTALLVAALPAAPFLAAGPLLLLRPVFETHPGLLSLLAFHQQLAFLALSAVGVLPARLGKFGLPASLLVTARLSVLLAVATGRLLGVAGPVTLAGALVTVRLAAVARLLLLVLMSVLLVFVLLLVALLLAALLSPALLSSVLVLSAALLVLSPMPALATLPSLVALLVVLSLLVSVRSVDLLAEEGPFGGADTLELWLRVLARLRVALGWFLAHR